MSEKEKKIVQSITEAVFALLDEKREFTLGYAEGVLAMGNKLHRSESPPADRDTA